MTQTHGQKPVYTTPEFDRWWQTRGSEVAAASGLDLPATRSLCWLAWLSGREHLSEATAHHRLQPIRR